MYKGDGGTAFGNETEGRERCEEEGGGSTVDEVGKGDEGSGEAYRWSIEGGDENFRVGVKCVGYIEVVGDKGFKPVSGYVFV